MSNQPAPNYSRRSLRHALIVAFVTLFWMHILPAATNQPAATAKGEQASPSVIIPPRPVTSASPVPSPATVPAPVAVASAASLASAISTPAAAETNPPTLVPRDLAEIHAKISLPKEWSLLPGKLLEGDVLLATREKITSENDPWSTGLSMTIDRNGAKDSGQKASEYAISLAREAREKAGDEASPLKESQSGNFHEIRFDFPVASEPPLIVTEVLRANDATGTLAVIIWQMPKEESIKLQALRDSILTGLILNPSL